MFTGTSYHNCTVLLTSRRRRGNSRLNCVCDSRRLENMDHNSLRQVLLYLLFIFKISALPTTTVPSLVASSTEPSHSKETTKENESTQVTPSVPKIYQMYVRSDISNRFARTTITSKVKNVAEKAQEATFSVVLPETAFISGFIMEIDGKNYTAYVKEKDEAKRDYDRAVASGRGAAHVAVSARDSNRFTVSVNMEAATKAAFYLTYEELLKRGDDHYEQVINLQPGHPVKDLSVEVVITESRKITYLKTPPLRSGNEIGIEKAELDPRADIEHVNDTAAIVKFNPNFERQKQLAHTLNTKEDEGLTAQFIVQYDVERDPRGGEVLIQDGYFVHFFAPSELEPLPKHVVFVLDTSNSMHGQKIEQLKQAMEKILEQLHDKDRFSLVEFNSNVKVWNIDNLESGAWFPRNNFYEPCSWQATADESEVSFTYFKFPKAYPATSENINKAKDAVSKLQPDGGTDIYSALRVGLYLVQLAKLDNADQQPMIIFLTDGDPTVRETLRDTITKKITEYNSDARKSPIFALSFGYRADKIFLQRLAFQNFGFNKHIYEAADASLQLQDFYDKISSPLLSNITFKYEPSVVSLTRTEFPIHFGGSELVVSGRYGTRDVQFSTVNAKGVHGEIVLEPTIQHTVSNIERLWAYLTVRQLLEKKETSDKDQGEFKKKALDLALKYSFVTPVSSLVVVKPNDTSAVDTENAAVTRPARARHSSRGRSKAVRKTMSFQPSAGGIGASIAGPGITLLQPSSPPSQRASTTTMQPPPHLTTEQPRIAVCPSPIFSSTGNSHLSVILPWLNNYVNDNGSLILPSGEYNLGLNETISENTPCSKTPLGAPGHCKLLQACPQVYLNLPNPDVFLKHICMLKEEYFTTQTLKAPSPHTVNKTGHVF